MPKVLTESGLKVAGEVLRNSLGRGSQGVKALPKVFSFSSKQNTSDQPYLEGNALIFPFQNDLDAIKKHTGIFS